VSRLDFREPAPDGVELPLLFLNVDFDRISDDVVRTSARGFRQALELSFDSGCQADAYGCTACVSHTHKLARCLPAVNLRVAREAVHALHKILSFTLHPFLKSSIIFTNRSNKYPESCGPGEASG
jgi:hypothetical protein